VFATDGRSPQRAAPGAGAEYLLKNLPQRNVDTSYYWYHATQVMYHMQANTGRRGTNGCATCCGRTDHQGPMAGTWDPADAREKTGGRICSTALRLLMLEVYYATCRCISNWRSDPPGAETASRFIVSRAVARETMNQQREIFPSPFRARPPFQNPPPSGGSSAT